MDETIGAKGGYNDRKRMLRISKEQKKKLKQYQKEKELKDLEKEVKRKQIYTLIKALPIAIAGGTIKTLYDTSTGKKNVDKEEENSKWRIKEYDADFTTRARGEEKPNTKKIVTLKDGRKVIIEIPRESEEIIVEPVKDVSIEEKKGVVKIDRFKFDEVTPKKEEKEELKKENQLEVFTKEKNVLNKPVGIDNTNSEDRIINSVDEFFPELSSKGYERLEKLKARKIIDIYEKQLKDIRYDLRELIFDYNMLVDEADEAIVSRELEEVIDRLNKLIQKIEKLKDKIQIENLDKYDDNYIYTLIEDYISEFKDGKAVDEIKDSPLYILIEKKLDELDTKKDQLSEKVDEKKDELEIKEDDFLKLKEKYYSIEKLNKDLLVFQNEQDMLLKEIREKVKNATTVSEKVEVQAQAMTRQSRRLLRMMMASMFFPAPKAARGVAASTAAYLYFMRSILNPPTTTRRYKVITVKDYSRDIEYSINAISDSIDLLSKTSKQIDKLIYQIKDEFKDYLGEIKECDELLSNLEKIKSEVREKEFEMERIKREQEKELAKNDAKVLTRGEYPM